MLLERLTESRSRSRNTLPDQGIAALSNEEFRAMPFMLRVRMSDGSERLAYLSDTTRESAEAHADKLLTQEGIERVRIEEFHEESEDDGALR
jgi:hypothetical protein